MKGVTGIMRITKMSKSVDEYLQRAAANFDPRENLLRYRAHSVVHSSLPPGTPVHPVRESACYAAALISSQEPANWKIGGAVLSRVTALQETDPTSLWYGSWPYFAEEPLQQMNPPDRNWTSFVGQYLFLAVQQGPQRLTREQRGAADGALRHVAYAIFRRNMQPAYTNIAVFEACLLSCVASGMNDGFFRDYAVQRLEQLVEYTEYHGGSQGGFNEYNSPPYVVVVLRSLELAHHYARDRRVEPLLAWLHRRTWESLADYYHAALGEITGPHSRAYSDVLQDSTRGFLAARTGCALQARYRMPGQESGWVRAEEVDFVPPWPCPEDLRSGFLPPVTAGNLRRRYFRESGRAWVPVPEDPYGCQMRHTVSPAGSGEWEISGYTAFMEDASLGTVNRDSLWKQRRPYLGYVATADDLAVIRIRVLKDGEDWASACIYNRQSGLNVLSVITFLRNFGDLHLFLDRHMDTRIHLGDLRIRIQVENASAPWGESDRKGWYAIPVGRYLYNVLIPPALQFDGKKCPVELAHAVRDSSGLESSEPRRELQHLDIRLPVTAGSVDLLRLDKTALFLATCLTRADEEPGPLAFPAADEANQFSWQAPPERLLIRTFGIPEWY